MRTGCDVFTNFGVRIGIDLRNANLAFDGAAKMNKMRKTYQKLCGACNGSGEGMRDGTVCAVCRGKGVA